MPPYAHSSSESDSEDAPEFISQSKKDIQSPKLTEESQKHFSASKKGEESRIGQEAERKVCH